MSPETTLSAHVHRARQRFESVGIPHDEADLDARLLAQHALGWDTAHFFREQQSLVHSDFETMYARFVERRARREPMAYILGEQEFWSLPFEVTPAVLIPRPETETIVEALLDRLTDSRSPLLIADVCTGSGCLGVVLAKEYGRARVVATDLSHEALIVAQRNASRHGVADRVRFVQSTLLEGVTGPLDVIVANPPYVSERERLNLQPEVRDYEPGLALYAGEDGFSVIEKMIPQAALRLAPGGVLLFEFGLGQDPAVRTLISASPLLKLVELKPDLQGIPRTAVAERIRL